MARASKPNITAKNIGDQHTAAEVNAVDTAIDAIIDDYVSLTSATAQEIASAINFTNATLTKSSTALATTTNVSDHAALTTGVHGVGAGTIAKTADIPALPFVTVGTTADCDYVTVGTADQAQFNTAIAALTSGGNIYVKRATYNLTAPITGTSLDNISLIFERGSKLLLGNAVDLPVIKLSDCDNWIIDQPEIDGNAANQSIAEDYFDYANGIVIIGGLNNQVKNAYIHDCRVYGFETFSPAVNCGITDSKIIDCGWNGVELGTHNTPAGVTSQANYAIHNEVANIGDVGITCYGYHDNVKNNYVHDIDGATGAFNSHYGITVEGHGDTSIIGNTISDCVNGIITQLDSPGGQKSIISSNHIAVCSNAGVFLGQGNVTVTNNKIDSCVAGVQSISGSDGNTISLNKIIDCSMACIDLNSSQNTLTGNNLSGSPIGILSEVNRSNNNIFGGNITDVAIGVKIDGDLNSCSGVGITEWDNADSYQNAIRVDGDSNSIIGNILNSTRANSQGINIRATRTNNQVLLNSVTCLSDTLTDSGTTSIIHFNTFNNVWTI